jgi:uncharacterized protein (TIGR02271 family)
MGNWKMRSSVRDGMFVRSTAGERLGKVISCGDDTFIIEKGLFSPKDYELRYEYVTEVNGGEIFYSLTDHSQRAASVETVAAAPMPIKAEAKIEPKKELKVEPKRDDGEVRIALMEEEVAVEKVNKEVGKVRIHKGTKIEERKLTVPVTHEEVIVEHIARDKTNVAPTDGFREQTFEMPLHEEEVHVVKRPVLREEVRVRRVALEEQHVATASVRHEEIDLEDSTHRLRPTTDPDERKV